MRNGRLILLTSVLIVVPCHGDFTISTVASQGNPRPFHQYAEPVYGGDGGQASLTSIGYPNSLASDPDGTIYFSDINYQPQLRKVGPDEFISTLFTGTYIASPSSLAVDSVGEVYVGVNSGYVWSGEPYKMYKSTGAIRKIAGNGRRGFSGDGGPALQAQILGVGSIIFEKAGNLFFSDFSRIRRISANGIITTVAETGVDGITQAPGRALDTPHSTF